MRRFYVAISYAMRILIYMSNEIQILSHDITDHSESFTLTNGKKEAFVSFSDSGRVNVLCRNAANKAWRGMGRFFDSAQDALDGYKSGAMKSMIEEALASYARI